MLVYSRRYDEGLAQLEKTAEMDPGFTSTYSALATAYRLMGKYAESVESYAKLQELNGRPQTAAFAFEYEPPRALFQTRMMFGYGRSDYFDITPDGKFLIGTLVGEPTAPASTVILNWQAAMKQ